MTVNQAVPGSAWVSPKWLDVTGRHHHLIIAVGKGGKGITIMITSVFSDGSVKQYVAEYSYELSASTPSLYRSDKWQRVG